jgi:hypothetical protein
MQWIQAALPVRLAQIAMTEIPAPMISVQKACAPILAWSIAEEWAEWAAQVAPSWAPAGQAQQVAMAPVV